jgi:hypothetical protein
VWQFGIQIKSFGMMSPVKIGSPGFSAKFPNLMSAKEVGSLSVMCNLKLMLKFQ